MEEYLCVFLIIPVQNFIFIAVALIYDSFVILLPKWFVSRNNTERQERVHIIGPKHTSGNLSFGTSKAVIFKSKFSEL
jgi:hypothetical protein